jgi:hypothetical protein
MNIDLENMKVSRFVTTLSTILALFTFGCVNSYDPDSLGNMICVSLPRKVQVLYDDYDGLGKDYDITYILKLKDSEEHINFISAIELNQCDTPLIHESCGCWQKIGSTFVFAPSDENKHGDQLFVECTYLSDKRILFLNMIKW